MVTKEACIKCRKIKELVSLPHIKSFCRGCFAEMIEKRIRKYVRMNKIFRKGDNILIIDELSFFLVKSIIKELPADIFLKNIEISDLSKSSAKNNIKKN